MRQGRPVSQRMRQRIVGTLVLVCVAIIVVPMLLDGEGVNAPELEVSVPPAPTPLPSAEPRREAPTGELPTPTLPPAPDPESTMTAAADTAASEASDQEAEADGNTDVLNDAGLLEGWSVRLGTFGTVANAENLMRELRADGHKAYTRVLRRDSGTLTAVLVGPVLERTEAARLRDELAADYGLDGMVVEFEVTSVE